MLALGEMRPQARPLRRDRWIAATAAANGLPVVTQDDDFGPLQGATGLDVIRI